MRRDDPPGGSMYGEWYLDWLRDSGRVCIAAAIISTTAAYYTSDFKWLAVAGVMVAGAAGFRLHHQSLQEIREVYNEI